MKHRARLVAVVSVLALTALFAGPLAAQQQVFNPGDDGVTLPELVEEAKAGYTAPALVAKIEGIVEMKAVVLNDGMVGDVAITKSLDAGLDQEAIAAWKRSSFRPGRRNGEPVAVRVDLQTRFTLKND